MFHIAHLMTAMPPLAPPRWSSALKVAAIARRNATLAASGARREAQSAGHVVVIGAGDGDLGARVVDLFADDVALEEKGAGGVQSVEGISLAEARAVAAGSGGGGGGTGRISVVKAALERVKTLVVLPSDPGPKGPSGGGESFAPLFGRTVALPPLRLGYTFVLVCLCVCMICMFTSCVCLSGCMLACLS